MPLTSVIVPIYNAQNHLRECIESILGQTEADIELLLIDDGSQDGSGSICDEYAACDPRIRVLHTPNRGVSAARNTGLDLARGEFVVFVDSDDRVMPEHLRQLIDCGIGEDGIAFTNLLEERPRRGGRSKIRSYPIPDRDISPQEGHEACLPVVADLLRNRCFGWVGNKMFARATIERLGLRFDGNLNYAEDEVFTARYCAHITHIATRSHPTYFYRYAPASLLHRPIDPEVIARTRTRINEIYEQGGGYDDEICYLTYRLCFSRLRRELRRLKCGCDPQADRLASLLLANWEKLNHYARPEFRKGFYDFKVRLLGWLICAPNSISWAKRIVRGLRL